MPAPGAQHTAIANPFEESRPRISEWTAKEIATISSRLDKQLGPEYISSRSGPGGSRVHYLTAEKCIGLANEVFGFNGWSSSIQNIQVDFADENPQTQRVSIGLSVIVRVTLRDGTYHEDIGYGSIDNARSKAMAFEKAKKEGTTDALKRTLRNFGNVLGNCIYDQDYVKQVTKLKAQPVKKFAESYLHRHSDFVKKEGASGATNVYDNAAPAGQNNNGGGGANGGKVDAGDSFEDFLGDFDEADFSVSEEGHPDEVTVSMISAAGPEPIRHGPTATTSTTMATATRPPQTPKQAQPRPTTMQPQNQQPNVAAGGLPSGEQAPVAFFSARSVQTDANQNPTVPPQTRHVFDPKAESPSIRKTPGIDHSSSKPVTRSGQHAPPASQSSAQTPGGASSGSGGGRQGNSTTKSGGSMVNPSLDHTRRIGAPGGPGSPLANRGSYKPPTMKRPLPGEANANAGARVPLSDVATNAQVATAGAATPADGADVKRQKTT